MVNFEDDKGVLLNFGQIPENVDFMLVSFVAFVALLEIFVKIVIAKCAVRYDLGLGQGKQPVIL